MGPARRAPAPPPSGGDRRGLPWSAATAAVEYWLVLPWLQPLVRMGTPYWAATLVHLSSGAAYPLFPWVRQALSGRVEDGAAAGRRAAAALVASLVALGALRALSQIGREPRWPLAGPARREHDRHFLRAMRAHHEVGLALSELAAERSTIEDVRTLGRLMYAEHDAEVRLLRTWWRSWYGGELPPPSQEDHERMAGMPAPGELEELERASDAAFDQRFLEVMIGHHAGAVEMGNQELDRGGDPRLRLLAASIRHRQVAQIARMRQDRG